MPASEATFAPRGKNPKNEGEAIGQVNAASGGKVFNQKVCFPSQGGPEEAASVKIDLGSKGSRIVVGQGESRWRGRRFRGTLATGEKKPLKQNGGKKKEKGVFGGVETNDRLGREGKWEEVTDTCLEGIQKN